MLTGPLITLLSSARKPPVHPLLCKVADGQSGLSPPDQPHAPVVCLRRRLWRPRLRQLRPDGRQQAGGEGVAGPSLFPLEPPLLHPQTRALSQRGGGCVRCARRLGGGVEGAGTRRAGAAAMEY